MLSDYIIEKIRNKLSESDPANRSVMHIFQFHFTDTEGQFIKSVVFDFKELNIYEGNSLVPDAEITISDENFLMVGTHQTTFDELMADNKVKVEGDKEAFSKMVQKIRSMPKRE